MLNKEGVTIMARVIERINSMEIPPHIETKLGLSKNWKKEISDSKRINEMVASARRFQEALKRLSKD